MPATASHLISAASLHEFARRLLAAGGFPADEAVVVAHSLVEANLRGHDSHGVMRIPYYLESLAKGELATGVDLLPLVETRQLLVADGQWGAGQVQARRLTERLIPRAQAHGVAVGTLRRVCHVGRLGEYCEQAAEAGLVSLLMVNTHGTARRVAPPGGIAPRLGTNPIAIGVPHAEAPLVLDFGTSAVAEGKVRVKRIAGERCPEGWLLDAQGQPTTDPAALYGAPPGTILPFGGDQAYKGFGLALMIEIFSGALSGGLCARERPINPPGNCLYLQLLDPARLGGQAHFAEQVAQLVEFVRGCPLAAGVDRVTLPGDPERQTRARREAEGTPFDEGNWQALRVLADRLGVPVPAL